MYDDSDYLSGYHAPIEMIVRDMQTQIDENCVKTVQQYGFIVDKEELKKALEYDRDQYKEGYEEGYRQGVINGRVTPQSKWIPVSERLPGEKLFNMTGSDFDFDFEEVLCTTIWGNVRAYKFGKPIGHDKPHFWLGGSIMDECVIAWQPLPEPYKEGGEEE